MLLCKSQAEDITQEVFVIAFQKKDAFLKHGNPEAFLYRTAKNLVLQYNRQEIKEKKTQLKEFMEPASEGDLLDALFRQQDRNIEEENYVSVVINSLSEDKKQLYMDYYVEHKSMEVIAEERGIRYPALRMKYVRLRRELKEVVEKLQLNG